MTQADVLRGDEILRDEILSSIDSGRELPQAQAWNVTPADIRDVLDGTGSAWADAVVAAYARPVLRVQGGRLQPPASPEWSRRLRAAGRVLEQRIRAVGRVVMSNHPRRRTAGSAWLSAPRTCITTSSVAADLGDGIEAWVEFPALGGGAVRVRIEEVIRAKDGDVAVLRIADDDDLPQPIPLSEGTAEDVAVVSYLTPESEAVTLSEAARRVVGISAAGVYVMPGRLAGDRHDATIAGDAAGGIVLDLATGAAVGMQAGRDRVIAADAIAARAGKGRTVAFKPRPQIEVREPEPEPDSEMELEAPADYIDRDGYCPAFIGKEKKFRVPLPTSTSGDTLEFEWNDRIRTELKYRHFSVVMSKSRQLCLFSAVNIDGKAFKKKPRKGWIVDRRIEVDQQITGDVYGNSPRFSRGHMTRREDPIWGPDDEAMQGNKDSMHFTNVAPQMQPFNAPVWLGLENYALQNARKDDMRISVFTGPFFRKNDPVRYGVRIPVEFWKVIAFIHDDTGRLTATGYKISQEEFLSPLEFVFGEFEEAQIPITLIENRAKLDFHGLAELDPLFGEESGYVTLTSHEEIRFF
ncbi:MAG: DNA/RNA non-specific endonuclease [Thermoanaerobaculia bacterium]